MVSITYPAGDYCRIQSYGGTIMGIVALVVGIGLILKNRNRNEEVARVIVYLASQEVLLKVCDAQIGSEFIK